MKKTVMFILAAISILTGLAYAADNDKIAVASDGKTTAAKVSGVAARSPYFLLFDRDGQMLEILDNPYKSARRKAGTQIVPFLAQQGVTFVVAGEFGQNMIQAMKGRGIKHLESEGDVQVALSKALEAVK